MPLPTTRSVGLNARDHDMKPDIMLETSGFKQNEEKLANEERDKTKSPDSIPSKPRLIIEDHQILH